MKEQASGAVYEAASSVLRATPVVVGGSTILGYSWSDFVNVLASISIALQIIWFMYDKWQVLRKGKDGSS